MSRAGGEVTRHALKLLPHQAALVETVFDPNSKRTILLRAAPGLGKGTALIAVAARLMRERESARALILAPSPLHFQFVQRLHNENVPSLLIDRYVYRELLDTTADRAVWPVGVVAVMSIDFAKQSEIRESLARTRWDLLIVDELHTMRRARWETIRQVDANRIVLVSATPFVNEVDSQLAGEDFTTVEWRYERIVDNEGNPFTAVPGAALHEIAFTLTESERELRTAAGELAGMLVADARNLESKILLRCLDSSLPAFEGTLQRLVARATLAGDFLDELSDSSDELETEALALSSVSPQFHNEIVEVAERLLQHVEIAATDSKLDAFKKAVAPFINISATSKRILVLTEFVATLYFLTAELEECGVVCKVLHGGMSIGERLGSLDLFLNEGGILVASSAAITYGVDLSGVTDLVLYDVPRHKDILVNILGRFNRVGRHIHLNIHVLTDDDRASEGGPHMLRDILGKNDGHDTERWM